VCRRPCWRRARWHSRCSTSRLSASSRPPWVKYAPRLAPYALRPQTASQAHRAHLRSHPPTSNPLTVRTHFLLHGCVRARHAQCIRDAVGPASRRATGSSTQRPSKSASSGGSCGPAGKPGGAAPSPASFHLRSSASEVGLGVGIPSQVHASGPASLGGTNQAAAISAMRWCNSRAAGCYAAAAPPASVHELVRHSTPGQWLPL